MKKFIIAILLILIIPVLHAEELRMYFYPEVVEFAINKHFSVMDRDRAAAEYEKRMGTDGTVTSSDIDAVCKAGRIDTTACEKFRKDLPTYFYSVCDKNAPDGKSFCVKDFWETVHGTWVRLPEAVEIAKEYALVKNKETVVCGTSVRSVNPPARASYVKCTSVGDEKHYYEFKFNSTTETDDRSILNGTLRAVGKIHDIDFKNADCTLERICSDSNCALSYKTDDSNQCRKINNSLQRFGYEGRINKTEKFGTRCEVFGVCGGNRTAYGLDNTVFQDVQYVYGPEIETRIKDYVQRELGRRNIKLESFRCDGSTKHDYTRSDITGFPNSHNEILTCYVNGSPIDFLFKDLSESGERAKEVGLSKMACAQIGGKVDGRDCRGLDEMECIRVSHKIPGGTTWDSKAEVCILNKADIDKKINDRIQILGGLVLAVGIGAVIAPEVVASTGLSETKFILLSGVGSVVADQGFIQIDRLEELKPAQYAHEFVNDALLCGIPAGTTRCNRTEVVCAMGVVSKHFGRLDEIMDKLSDSQLQSVVEAMINVTDCLDKDQLTTALNTVTIETNLKDKVLNNAGTLWLAAGIFLAPEDSVARLMKRAPKIARVLKRCTTVDRVSELLGGARYTRIYVDNLNTNQIRDIVAELRSSGLVVSSNIEDETYRRFIGVADRDVFGPWKNSKNNWLNLIIADDLDNFYKFYKKMPEEEVQRRLKYVLAHSTNDFEFVDNIIKVNVYNPELGRQFGRELGNAIVVKLYGNPDLVDRLRHWKEINLIQNTEERERVIEELHNIITTQHRTPTGRTVIGFNPPGLADGGHGIDEFEYDIRRDDIQEIIKTVFHENTHAFQSVGNTTIPKVFCEISEEHYISPYRDRNYYKKQIIEEEAEDVATAATEIIMQVFDIR